MVTRHVFVSGLTQTLTDPVIVYLGGGGGNTQLNEWLRSDTYSH